MVVAILPLACLTFGASVGHRGATTLPVLQDHATGTRGHHATGKAVLQDEPLTATRFLQDLEFLGPCRFVVVGPGAILEGVGAFENLRTKDGLATVSNDDNSFECHIRLAHVKRAQFAKKTTGEKQLHIIRLIGEDDKSLLSAILHPEGECDEVDAGAIDFYDSLRARFGDEPLFANEDD